MKLKYFSINELIESPTARRKGIDNFPQTHEVLVAIETLISEVLNPLREIMNRPIYVNSGYRCPALNEAVGGVPNSQHLRGEAADVTWCDYNKYRPSICEILDQLPRGFDQAIVYPTFLHISYTSKDKNRNEVIIKSPKQ